MRWIIGLIFVMVTIVSSLIFAGIVGLSIALDEWRKQDGEDD